MKKKNSKNSVEFPKATIAFYGPDDKLATKAVIGIVLSEGAAVDPIHKWITAIGDIRKDREIGKEIRDFIVKHRVMTVSTMDKIIGCPHEEGKDYPHGTDCPACPFWAGRDRFTGRLKV